MTKKSKIIMIAAIAAAVVLIVAGIIIAIVANNGYLDSLKKYDVASGYSYDGVEILEKDGLYYLTKDGKKLSKTGYTYLESVNDSYHLNDKTPGDLAKAEDFELYDWYIARKPEVNTYFLVNTEGEEKAIEGETLEYQRCDLPYVIFYDTVTYEYGAVSLKNFDSALSSDAGEEISVNMFDYILVENVDDDKVQAEYLYAHDLGDGTANSKYIYVDTNGAKLFESINSQATTYNLYDKASDTTVRFFLTGMKELYNIKGELVASDIKGIKPVNGEYITKEEYVCSALKLACAPIDDTLTADQNAANEYVQYVSIKTTFKLPVKEYNVSTNFYSVEGAIENINSYGNLVNVATKNPDGTVATSTKLFNVITGDSIVCNWGVAYVDTDLIRIQGDEAGTTFAYVDTETGATLMQTKYSGMKWYRNIAGDAINALYDVAESVELNAAATDPAKAPKAYLHFVSSTKTAVNLTLAYNEDIYVIKAEKDAPVFEIRAIDEVAAINPESEGYSIEKKAIYMPYAATARSAAYDKVQYLSIFADGIGVVLGTDFDGGKFDFIDAATGNVVKSVAAAGAEMAKTSFAHYATYILRQDNFVEESNVELAIFTMKKTDDIGELASAEYFVMSRNVVMADDDKLATNAITVTEIGKDIHDIYAEDGHLVVNTTPRAGTLYTINDSYALEQVVSLSYKIYDIEYYSNNIDEYYIEVVDEQYGSGLYNAEGEQILPTVYDELDVVDEEYFVVLDKGAYGAFKYNVKNGKVKQILDFKYEMISYLSDGGFAVIDGFETYLYEDGKLVKDEKISNSSLFSERRTPPCIYAWSVDEETGKLACAFNYYFNFEGKLYIHRTEGEQVMVDDSYDYSDVLGGYYYDNNEMPQTVTIHDAGVKVVNFRNTDGSIIETKVVYPTAKSAFEFAMTETWYSTPIKKLQGIETAVSDVMIESIDGNAIVNVYKAHPVAAAIAG